MVAFTEEQEKDLYPSRIADDVVVILVKIMEYDVIRILIDTGSSVYVLFFNVFDELGLDQSKLKPCP